MPNRQTPLSDRLRAGQPVEPHEIAALERAVYVAENGKWQRRLAVLTIIAMLGSGVGVVLAWAFWGGGEYREWKQAIGAIPGMRQEQSAMKTSISEIQSDHRRLLRAIGEEPRIGAARPLSPATADMPAFAREDRFSAVPREP